MPNIWKQFTNLLPDAPLLIGTVATRNSDGTLTVSLAGGGLLKATGNASDGERVFVRNGLVEGTAPDLPVVDIEI